MRHRRNYITNKNNTNNKINKIDKIVDEIKEKIDHQSKIRIGQKYIDLNYLNIAITFATLVVSFIAMFTSYKISTNNSLLHFEYENISVDSLMGEKTYINVGNDIGTQGGVKININAKVISGQLKSLYLIQKHNRNYNFILLNNGDIQDKFSGIKKYTTNIYIDMEQITNYEKHNIGIGQLYILSEDLNNNISIDVVQIIGPIIWRNDNDKYSIEIDFNNPEYNFRYLKNNKLVTLYNDNDRNEGWVNLSDKYLDLFEETNIDEIEEDIAIIKERYSRY